MENHTDMDLNWFYKEHRDLEFYFHVFRDGEIIYKGHGFWVSGRPKQVCDLEYEEELWYIFENITDIRFGENEE